MKSRDKGHLGVLKVELRAIEKGWIVSRPTHDDCRYDLVLDDGARLYRAQVKYSGTKSSNSENSIPVKLNRVGNKGQSLGGYQAEDVDVILAQGILTRGLGLAVMNRLRKAANFNIIKA